MKNIKIDFEIESTEKKKKRKNINGIIENILIWCFYSKESTVTYAPGTGTAVHLHRKWIYGNYD